MSNMVIHRKDKAVAVCDVVSFLLAVSLFFTNLTPASAIIVEELRSQVGYLPEAFGVIATINFGALCVVRFLRKKMHLRRGQ